MHIEIAKTDAEIVACWSVLQQMLPHLAESTFVADVRRMERESFRLAALFDPDLRAVAGYREMELFATGRILYVDDLVTDSRHRSKGYGKTLLDWLVAEARRLECKFLELDTGVKRVDAHRFYHRCGLEEVAKHFAIATS